MANTHNIGGGENAEQARELRERLARAIHEQYRENQKGKKSAEDPSMRPWEDLAPDLRESNLQQADQIPEKMQRIGYVCVAASGEHAAPFQFSSAEVEALAEMEHARWVEERVKSGWTLGARDPDNKMSPYLVAYEFLTDEVKEYDRQAVRAIPAVLARAQLGLGRHPG
jgi:hypothetical protein